MRIRASSEINTAISNSIKKCYICENDQYGLELHFLTSHSTEEENIKQDLDLKVCSNTDFDSPNLHNEKLNVLVNSIENNIEAEHDNLDNDSENITECLEEEIVQNKIRINHDTTGCLTSVIVLLFFNINGSKSKVLV